ncbi:MAG: hypothetical protein SF052_22770 [Bacteroidia bacterium]|nr:hypothetical protein [Bacteroidia bacterium]
MKEIIIKIPDKEYKFFMKLVKSLGFVKIEKADEGDSKKEIEENLVRGFEEMRLFREGKVKGTLLKDFLNEL